MPTATSVFNFEEFPAGSIVFDKLEVIRCLGRGSSSVVYLCEDLKSPGQVYALKVFPETTLGCRFQFRRLHREIQAISRVQHPNVTRFYEYLRGSGLVGFTMEYVDSGTLGNLLAQDKRLTIREVLGVMFQCLCGLQAIHDRVVIHGDIKPDNLFVSADSVIKIGDFGIARIPVEREGLNCLSAGKLQKLLEAEAIGDTVLRDGLVGTPAYMCPEYLSLGRIDQRADIYALGTMCFQLACGELPYAAGSVSEMIKLKIEQDARPLSSVLSNCPAALSDIIGKMLRRSPKKRYSNAAKVMADLSPLITNLPPEENLPKAVRSMRFISVPGIVTASRRSPLALRLYWRLRACAYERWFRFASFALRRKRRRNPVH